jgi:hypothetical protein
MKWIRTPDSSAITGFGYESEKRILDVKFKHGHTYAYLKVPARKFEEMKAAPSKGRFVTAQIKGKYDYREK